MNTQETTPQSRAEIAFEGAIAEGRLSSGTQDHNYAGKYMYMGKDKTGKDLFKHIDTRKYIN